MGNPGWIESYLISVQQSKGLILQNITKEGIIIMGLVVPPREMLLRYNIKICFIMNYDSRCLKSNFQI